MYFCNQRTQVMSRLYQHECAPPRRSVSRVPPSYHALPLLLPLHIDHMVISSLSIQQVRMLEGTHQSRLLSDLHP